MHRDETRVLSPCETGFAHGHRCGPPPAQGQAVREGTPRPVPGTRPPRPDVPWCFDSAVCYPLPFPKSWEGLSCEAGGGYSSISACLGWGQSPG